MTDARKTAASITGPCTCFELYKDRGLIAPDCVYHHYADEIAEAIEAARKDVREKAAELMDQGAALYKLYAERAGRTGDQKKAVEMGGHYLTMWAAAANIRALEL
jgi:methionine synthase II (cobalamin-independent)